MDAIVKRLSTMSFADPEYVLFLLGTLVFTKVSGFWILMVLKNLYAHLLRGRKTLTKYGEWAVVTGASDGIGKCYALELAKSKMKVVLIARSTDKLEAVAKEIAEAGGETKIISADLTQADALTKIEEGIAGLDVGILVNNAGLSYEYPDWLANVPADRLESLLTLNIIALTKMCHMVLPGMAERKRGSIVNISSVSGTAPMGLLTAYSASKAYVDFFSEGLNQEYAPQGIDVQSVIPFFVATAMAKQRPSFTVPTPKAYVKAAVNSMGFAVRTEAFWVHRVMAYVISLLPRDFLLGKLFAMHKDIRRRAIRKKERKAAEAAKNQ